MKKSILISLILGFILMILSIFTTASYPQPLESISLYQKSSVSTDAIFAFTQFTHSDAGLNVNLIMLLINWIILPIFIYFLIKLYIFCVDKRKWLF